MLIVLGGLPGSGKTTLAKALASRLGAALVRIDAIEQAAVDTGVATHPVGEVGYVVGYAVARDNLEAGATVIADSVNPVAITRLAWRKVADEAGVLVVEVVCSDTAEHRGRVEGRENDIPGLPLPTWAAVQARDYEPWRADLVIDTAGRTVADCLDDLRRHMPHLFPER